MQLSQKNKGNLGAADVATLLSVATCSLLMGAPVAGVAADIDNPWRVEMGAMHYTEEDRITVNEGTARIRRQIDDDTFVKVRTGYDSVSGSSPTGAVKIQSTSSASGTAYLAEFNATRISIGADVEAAIRDRLRVTLSADHSTQATYNSTGVGATLAQDLNQRNTTLVGGVGYSYDRIEPETGIHYGLASTADTNIRRTSEEKEQLDIQLGITQVLARGTLAQINYIYGHAVGYMSNPYKIISVVNESSGSTGDYDPLYEKRPRIRDSNIIYAQLNQSLGNHVAYFSYRYFQDDWGINAHTMDIRYRHTLSEHAFIQPHVRYYSQSAADFYRSMLTNTEVANLPQYASADYRLAEFTTTTVGVKFGYRPQVGGELSARFEVIRQSGEQRPWDAVGIQQDEGVFPTLDAVMVSIAYTVPF